MFIPRGFTVPLLFEEHRAIVGLYKLNPAVTHSLKAPDFKPLNLKCDILVSKFAFKFQLVPLHRGGRVAASHARLARRRRVGL